MPNQLRTAQLKITDFSREGHGLGTWHPPHEGLSRLVEVPFSMPGDEVKVGLLKRRGGIYRSFPLEWVHLSQNRTIPRCQHFGKCGGCRWQHIPYEEQLKIKESWVRHYLEPYLDNHVIWWPIIPCSPPWEYRNKMELSFSNDKNGKRYLGLILYGTRGHVFQIQECHLARPWMTQIVKSVSEWWTETGLEAYHLGSDKGSLRNLTLREGIRTGDRMVILTVSGNPNYALNQKHLSHFIASLRKSMESEREDHKLSIFLRIQQICKGKKTQFFEMLLYGPDHIHEIINIETAEKKCHSLKFRISPTAFFQPNTRQAEFLYSQTIKLMEPSADSTVYDLYCGIGTLGICLAKQVKEVIGIELSPESTLDAQANVKLNGLKNVTIYTGDVGQLLPNILEKEKKIPDIVLVDPPRAGLDSQALKHLLKIKAPKLVYISCNPASQAANLQTLVKEGGYRVSAVQPVDQFPQTVHVENIVLLT